MTSLGTNDLGPGYMDTSFIWKRNEIVAVLPPVYTERMKTIMKTQTFEYGNPKWIDLKTQRNKNGTI